jgi:hypothetical protein
VSPCAYASSQCSAEPAAGMCMGVEARSSSTPSEGRTGDSTSTPVNGTTRSRTILKSCPEFEADRATRLPRDWLFREPRRPACQRRGSAGSLGGSGDRGRGRPAQSIIEQGDDYVGAVYQLLVDHTLAAAVQTRDRVRLPLAGSRATCSRLALSAFQEWSARSTASRSSLMSPREAINTFRTCAFESHLWQVSRCRGRTC